jgi:glycosyltransferase involved in cell wall biosynthesis
VEARIFEPKVSVIIPAYNRAGSLPRAVQSVKIQDFDDYEIVICDDASTDNTVEVAQQMAAVDPKIKIVQLEQNHGAAAARNGAMQAASGKYFAFLDSDDEWLPGKLTRQVEIMEKTAPDVGVCLTGAEIIKNRTRKAYDIPLKEWEEDPLVALVTGKLAFTTSTIMLRRECIENVGLMSLKLRRGQDVDFLIRIFMRYGLITVPDVYVKMHLTTYGKATYQHMLVKANFMIESYYDELKECRGMKVSERFKARLYRNILCAALRDHYYFGAVSYLIRLFSFFPLLNLGDFKHIFKAFLHGIYYWRS